MNIKIMNSNKNLLLPDFFCKPMAYLFFVSLLTLISNQVSALKCGEEINYNVSENIKAVCDVTITGTGPGTGPEQTNSVTQADMEKGLEDAAKKCIQDLLDDNKAGGEQRGKAQPADMPMHTCEHIKDCPNAGSETDCQPYSRLDEAANSTLTTTFSGKAPRGGKPNPHWKNDDPATKTAQVTMRIALKMSTKKGVFWGCSKCSNNACNKTPPACSDEGDNSEPCETAIVF